MALETATVRLGQECIFARNYAIMENMMLKGIRMSTDEI